MLILLCYQERHGLCYQLIYWKSSPESIRFLIVSWTSKTEEKWMSLGLPGVPADHCGFLGTDFQLIQMRPERQLLQIHAVGPAAQRWLTERLGGGGETKHFLPTSRQVHSAPQQMLPEGPSIYADRSRWCLGADLCSLLSGLCTARLGDRAFVSRRVGQRASFPSSR